MAMLDVINAEGEVHILCTLYTLIQSCICTSPELIIHSTLPIIQIFYSHISSLLFKKHPPIIHSFCKPFDIIAITKC